MGIKRATEESFMRTVIELAKLRGWLVYHTHNSTHSESGFPDLVMVRGDSIIYAELKTQKGVVSVEQATWMERLSWAGAHVYLWRPSDWQEIESVLSSHQCQLERTKIATADKPHIVRPNIALADPALLW